MGVFTDTQIYDCFSKSFLQASTTDTLKMSYGAAIYGSQRSTETGIPPPHVPSAYANYPSAYVTATQGSSRNSRGISDLESGTHGPKRDVLTEFTETSVGELLFVVQLYRLDTLSYGRCSLFYHYVWYYSCRLSYVVQLEAFGFCLAGNMIDPFRYCCYHHRIR